MIFAIVAFVLFGLMSLAGVIDINKLNKRGCTHEPKGMDTVTISDFNGVRHKFKIDTKGFIVGGEYNNLCVCEVQAILNHK